MSQVNPVRSLNQSSTKNNPLMSNSFIRERFVMTYQHKFLLFCSSCIPTKSFQCPDEAGTCVNTWMASPHWPEYQTSVLKHYYFGIWSFILSLLLLFIPLSSSLHVSPSLWILFSIHPFVPSLRYQYQCFCFFICPHNFALGQKLFLAIFFSSCVFYFVFLYCLSWNAQGPRFSFGLCWLAALCLI